MTMLWIAVDRSQKMPFISQVYDQIRLSIVRGELRSGEQLPSTRQLARDLGVSRIIIVEVYDQLLAEGYLESRQGSGTYIAEGASLEVIQREHFPPVQTLADSRAENRSLIDFRAGLPALDLFPRKLWGQLGVRVCAESSPSVFGYDHPEGCVELSAADAVLSPIPVDENGMQTALLPREIRPAFVFVTPSHQFPLGGLLPIQRRIYLIQFARTARCYIVEDDYDSEFRYNGTPVSSLQELDPEHVIYVGTLSKSLSPALRLGYVVLPPPS